MGGHEISKKLIILRRRNNIQYLPRVRLSMQWVGYINSVTVKASIRKYSCTSPKFRLCIKHNNLHHDLHEPSFHKRSTFLSLIAVRHPLRQPPHLPLTQKSYPARRRPPTPRGTPAGSAGRAGGAERGRTDGRVEKKPC